MGFWDSLGKGIGSAINAAGETMAKKICDGDPIRNAPRKVSEILSLIKGSHKYDDESLYNQRISMLRTIMNYLKNQAVADYQADQVRKEILSRHGNELRNLGIND